MTLPDLARSGLAQADDDSQEVEDGSRVVQADTTIEVAGSTLNKAAKARSTIILDAAEVMGDAMTVVIWTMT